MRATKAKQSVQRAAQQRQAAQNKAATPKGGLGVKAELDASFLPYLLGQKAEPEVEDGPEPGPAEKNTHPAPSPEPSAETESVKNAQYAKVEGEAFVKGRDGDKEDAHEVSPDDVRQGSLGNCYLMAALAAVAKTDPDILKNMVKDNGDGTFTVSFHLKEGRIGVFSATSTVAITVTDQFPLRGGAPAFGKTGDQGPKGPELWVMIIEKAWAVHQGSYEQSRGSKSTMDSDIMQYLTGQKSRTFYTSGTQESELAKVLHAATKGGHPATASMPAKTAVGEDIIKLAEDKGLYFNHAYTVMTANEGGSEIILRNPWGSHDPKPLKAAELKKIFARIKINAA